MMKEQTLDTGDIVLNYAENDNRGMSRTYHVFAPDLRGHGKSGHSGFGYSLEAYVDDVVHLMNQQFGNPPSSSGRPSADWRHRCGSRIACNDQRSGPA